VGEYLWGDIDPQLVRVAVAFCGGVGGTHEELCGAFSGGVMVLGILFAPEQPGGNEDRMRAAIARYRERFLAEAGSMTCAVLTATRYGDGFKESCADLVQQAVRILIAVIAEFGEDIEPPVRMDPAYSQAVD
jgi:C_GCAxxG_C_C family probable redox protein